MLISFGLSREDMSEIIDVFPDNWDAFMVFDGMSTQWRSAGAGATGLDYNVLPLVAESVSVGKKKLSGILSDIRVLESEALRVMIEERESSR